MTRTILFRRAAGPLAVAGLLAVAAPAAAQDTSIVLGGEAATALRDAGVRIAARPPARAGATRIALPVDAVTIAGRTASVTHRGSLRLSAGRRSVALTDLRVSVGPASKLTARAGDRRLVLAIRAPAYRRTVAADGTSITEAPLRLSAAGARLLRQRLDRPAIAAGRLGTIDLDADATATVTIPGAPPPPTVTGPPTPGGAAPAIRPAGAVSIVGGSAHWSPRSSWIGYLAQGEGASASDGASFDGTTYTLPIRDGWFDRATGRAVVDTTGTTRFHYSAHSLDLVFGDWSYDLAGPAPKAVALVERADDAAAGTRQPLALVGGAGVAAVVAGDGTAVTWTDLPLTLSAEGVPLLKAYLYGSDQGRLTISATLG